MFAQENTRTLTRRSMDPDMPSSHHVTVDIEAMTLELPSLSTHYKRLMDAATVAAYSANLTGRPVFTVLWRGQAVGTLRLREMAR